MGASVTHVYSTGLNLICYSIHMKKILEPISLPSDQNFTFFYDTMNPMRSVLALLIFLIFTLIVYLVYSERFPYFNATIYQKIGLESEALRLYKVGCDGENMLSCMELAQMYERDEHNRSEAIRVYRGASDRGFKPATERLKELDVHP